MKRRPSDWLKWVKMHVEDGVPMTYLANKYKFNVSHLKHKVHIYMLNSIVNYEGVDLIFSVARGFSHYKKGDRYQDVLQRADSEMYINKKMLKEKYNMKGR